MPVNTCDGYSPNDKSVKAFALVKKGLKQSAFVDPKEPPKGRIHVHPILAGDSPLLYILSSLVKLSGQSGMRSTIRA